MLKLTFILYLLAQSGDITTSIIKYKQGCVESLWPNGTTMIVTKSAAISFTFTIRHRKLSLIPEIPGIASGIYGTVHNLNTSCSKNY